MEGHELEVLEGASETIQKYKPIILCESENRHLILKQKSTEQVVSYMSSFNYDTFVISNKHLQIFPFEEINIPRDKTSNSENYYNYWFIHKNHVTDVVMKIQGILTRFQTAKTS